MENLYKLSSEDIDQLAVDVEELSKKSEEEIFRMIGNVLDLEGLEVSSSKSDDLLGPKESLLKNKRLSLTNAFDYVEHSVTPSDDVLIDDGKKFWEGVKERIKKEICSNKTIRDLMTSPHKLRDLIAKLIELIIDVVFKKKHVSVLLQLCIAAVIVLLIKQGYDEFCGISIAS